MMRFGGSPYANQIPQIVVTAVHTMTAYRMAADGAAASIMMMTSVRIVSPIIETPSSTPEAKATAAVTAMTVGRIRPSYRRSRTKCHALRAPGSGRSPRRTASARG